MSAEVREVPSVEAAGKLLVERESPPVPSLLICPAQWTALLEATPVSLVRRQRGEEGSWFGAEGEGGQEKRREDASTDTTVTDGGTPPPESPPRQVCVEMGGGKEEGRDSTRAQVQEQEKAPSLGETMPPQDQLCLPMEGEEGATAVPSQSVGEGGVKPLPPLDQLCLSMEGVEGVKATPSPDQLCLPIEEGEEGDVPSFAPPEFTRATYQTHSRNVSETHSLPPFYSSSTSSAYHSRNSSLGSQLSSCFETDSILNQITDIDSCLAVQTGSHGDTKQQPIRLQDSRLRLYDSSSVELHHMGSPICSLVDPRGGASPAGLEDTLRMDKWLEKRGGKKMVEGLGGGGEGGKRKRKSSDWIKEQLERGREHEHLVQVKLSSKSKHVVHFNVKAGDLIVWEFATKKRDVGFGVSFEPTVVATEQQPLASSHESLQKAMLPILPTLRVCTHSHPVIGSHRALQDGVYEIIWDNTYSRFFAKELFYRISTEPSVPDDNYLQQ